MIVLAEHANSPTLDVKPEGNGGEDDRQGKPDHVARQGAVRSAIVTVVVMAVAVTTLTRVMPLCVGRCAHGRVPNQNMLQS